VGVGETGRVSLGCDWLVTDGSRRKGSEEGIQSNTHHNQTGVRRLTRLPLKGSVGEMSEKRRKGGVES